MNLWLLNNWLRQYISPFYIPSGRGALVAGLAGIIMICTKRSSSASRYNLLAGSMLLFVLCTIATFVHYSNTLSDGTTLTESAPAYMDLNPQASQLNIIDKILSSIYSYSNSIVLLWFAIICLRSFQLALGLHRVSNLKKQKLIDPGAYWTGRVNILSERLRIGTIVKFAESGLTAIPLTVGYLKPIILVPAGMLAAIPQEQIEAILLHELAHIKRKDYFVNIFQSLVEVVYFFNPAVWWLSSLLRTERENCCDDIAIANSGSKTNYVRALISFEEYRQQLPQLAVAFTGNETSLIKRTKRIIYNQNNTLNSMEKFILTSGLILSGLVSLAFTDGGKKQISKALKPVVSTIAENFPMVERAFPVLDTVPATITKTMEKPDSEITYNSIRDGIPYRIIVKNNKVDELYVSNIQIPRNRISEYAKITTEIIEHAESSLIAAEDEKKQAEQSKALAEQSGTASAVSAAAPEHVKLTIANAGNKNNNIENIVLMPPPVPKAIRITLKNDQIESNSLLKESKIALSHAKEIKLIEKPGAAIKVNLVPVEMIKKIRFKSIPVKGTNPPVHKARTIPAEEIREPFEAKPVKNDGTSPKVLKAIPVYQEKKAISPDGPPMGFYKPKSINTKIQTIGDQIGKELIKEGLIKDPARFSYKVTNNDLFINGIKQNGSIQRHILSKLTKKHGDKIDFTYNM